MEKPDSPDGDKSIIIYETRRFLEEVPKYLEPQEIEILKAALVYRPEMGEISEDYFPLRVIRWAGSPETNIFYGLTETDTAIKIILIAISPAKAVPTVKPSERRRIVSILETLTKLGVGAVLKKIIDTLLE